MFQKKKWLFKIKNIQPENSPPAASCSGRAFELLACCDALSFRRYVAGRSTQQIKSRRNTNRVKLNKLSVDFISALFRFPASIFGVRSSILQRISLKHTCRSESAEVIGFFCFDFYCAYWAFLSRFLQLFYTQHVDWKYWYYFRQLTIYTGYNYPMEKQ